MPKLGKKKGSKLLKDKRLKKEKISAEIANGMATLTGSVSDLAATKIAENNAYMIRGVHTVNNLLHVKDVQKDDRLTQDEEIKNRIVKALSWNSLINPNLIIETSGGTAKITGSVDAYWQKLLMIDLVNSVAGVLRVEEQISVAPPGNYDDEMIAKNIRNAIARNYQVDPDQVIVKAKGGIVELSGKVDSQAALRAAVNSASFTPGVKEIHNRLKVTAD